MSRRRPISLRLSRPTDSNQVSSESNIASLHPTQSPIDGPSCSCYGYIVIICHSLHAVFLHERMRISVMHVAHLLGRAQSVEHLTAEREGPGSIPGAGPILKVLK